VAIARRLDRMGNGIHDVHVALCVRLVIVTYTDGRQNDSGLR
jgi:hypothetical protein